MILVIKTVSITPRWQIYLPVSIRERLGLEEPTQAEISVRGNEIILRPKESQILKLEGSLAGKTPKKPVRIDKIRDQIDYSDL